MMLEFAEVTNISAQLKTHVVGKRVKTVFPPTKHHKFCWFSEDPCDYNDKIAGTKINLALNFGIYVEIVFDNGYRLCINDGVNVRLLKQQEAPKNYQLLITFDDDTCLVFTVTMYGGIILHDGNYDNQYYIKSKHAISPLSNEFANYFNQIMAKSNAKLSAKAFLATEQRFPGIGNGSVQDILLAAGIHPKRKIGSFSADEKEKLLYCIITVLSDMVVKGGRDTEKDLFGNLGSYQTKLSKNTLKSGCSQCGNEIIKEQYLGGAIYYCSRCQPLKN